MSKIWVCVSGITEINRDFDWSRREVTSQLLILIWFDLEACWAYMSIYNDFLRFVFNEKNTLVHYFHQYYITYVHFIYLICVVIYMWLYQCWSSLDLKLFIDIYRWWRYYTFWQWVQLFITPLLKQCCRIVLHLHFSSFRLWLLMGHVSATYCLRHTHCVGICISRSCSHSRI